MDTLLVPRSSRRVLPLLVAALLAVPVLLSLRPSPASATTQVAPSTLLAWSKQSPSTAPSGRWHAAAAFDPVTGTTVFYGGRAGPEVLGDTWAWDGATWRRAAPAVHPPALESASMVYDSTSHHLVLFGGVGTDGRANDATWSWDGTAWSALNPAASPPPRYGASFVSRGSSGTAIMFGGLSAPGSPLDDTWSWDGSTWAQLTPGTSPSARSGAAAAFDAKRGLIVLFGGATASEVRGDTWIWDGARWAQQSTAAAPPARTDASLAYDPTSQAAVLFGGGGMPSSATFSDTWLWNGSDWSTSLPLSLVPTAVPPPRAGAALVGARNGGIVLFGGTSPGNVLSDTWTARSEATRPTTSPTGGAAPDGSTTTTAGPSPSTSGKATNPSPGRPRPPDHQPPPPQALLVLASHSLRKGEDLKLSGGGFQPGSTVTILFRSAPVVLGHIAADAQGHFAATVLVPPNAPPGSHRLEAVGTAPDGGQAQLVARISLLASSHRGSWLLPAFLALLTVLVATAAGAVLSASARWQPSRGD